LPLRMERADDLLGVEGEPEAAGQGGLDMAAHILSELQAEAAVERERGGQIGDHQADHIESCSHVDQPMDPIRGRLEGNGQGHSGLASLRRMAIVIPGRRVGSGMTDYSVLEISSSYRNSVSIRAPAA